MYVHMIEVYTRLEKKIWCLKVWCFFESAGIKNQKLRSTNYSTVLFSKIFGGKNAFQKYMVVKMHWLFDSCISGPTSTYDSK